MTLGYYFDQHIPRAIASELLRQEIDVLTTQDEGTEEWSDEPLFERAVELGRIMVTQDSDYLAIANRWLAAGRSFPGLVRAIHPRRDIGGAVEDLQLIAVCYSAEEMINRIVHIPL